MILDQIRIHNYRSITEACIAVQNFTMLIGANNAGKSNFINALRCFYGDLKWTADDLPKNQSDTKNLASWVELSFVLSDAEWNALDKKYKTSVCDQRLILKRYFQGPKAKARQSNIYAVVNGKEDDTAFYGANNTGITKCGRIIYIPALTSPNEQLKTSGPSPLRDLLSYMLSRSCPQSPAYAQLGQAIEQLNDDANRESGFLSTIAQPLNDALRSWNVRMDLSVNPITPEVIIKSLFSYSFADQMLGNVSFGLDRFGHGFQRAVIFELIRLASSMHNDNVASQNSDFDPDFTLFLFEEPEAFLHPSQQENMAYYLRRIAQKSGQQVFVTSHSPVFVSKNGDELAQICRIQKINGISQFYQLGQKEQIELFDAGGDLLNVLKRYVANSNASKSQKERAQNLIDKAPSEDIAAQYEKFRFQMWLDSDRASLFFADKVLLVEGATEKMLFNYLLSNDWHDLTNERILVVDALGKYNFHRFLSLFEAYGIKHGIMLDNDNNNNEHAVINQLIRDRKNAHTLADPFEFEKDLETFLGISLPNRNEQKPLNILHALKTGTIQPERLVLLREAFCKALGINKH